MTTNLTPEEAALVPPGTLLRPHEVEDQREELGRLNAMVEAPLWQHGGMLNRGEVLGQKARLEAKLASEEPKPFEPRERDLAISALGKLEEAFTAGMPTHAEMRRNPAGAVDKHMSWEDRAKPAVLAWKKLRLRALTTGMISDRESGDFRFARDVANIERLRRAGGSGELNMHNEQIPGARIYLPPVIRAQNVMPAEDRDKWKSDLVELQLAQFRGPPNKSRRALARKTLVSMLGEAEAERLIAAEKAGS